MGYQRKVSFHRHGCIGKQSSKDYVFTVLACNFEQAQHVLRERPDAGGEGHGGWWEYFTIPPPPCRGQGEFLFSGVECEDSSRGSVSYIGQIAKKNWALLFNEQAPAFAANRQWMKRTQKLFVPFPCNVDGTGSEGSRYLFGARSERIM